MKILILLDSHLRVEWNHADFANSFLDKEWDVFYGMINSLSTRNFAVYCDVVQVTSKVEYYKEVNNPVAHENIENYNLIWVMNQPHQALAKDTWQILWMLSKRVPFVNSVESMVFLNNKNNLGLIIPLENLVETYIANEYRQLLTFYSNRPNEHWVVKPTNAGCGADVYLLQPGDSNARVILQSMTGNVVANSEINNPSLIGIQNKYSILQGYVSQVKQGEKRVLLAGGTVVAQHGRKLASEDHRSNMSQGGELVRADLSSEEMELCLKIAQRLFTYGVNFIGIDMAYPYILEFNIVNPGGIYDILDVTGINYAPIVVDRILSAIHI